MLHVTVDCSDAARLADFWAADLGGEAIVVEDNPGEFKTTVVAPGIALLFNPVAKPKAPKNRAHFNLQPQGRGRDAEAMQLLAPGGGTGGRPAQARRMNGVPIAHSVRMVVDDAVASWEVVYGIPPDPGVRFWIRLLPA